MVGVYEQQLKDMLEPVAKALGPDLLPNVAFVGGSTTGLLITDNFTREAVRYTEDVDVIVGVDGRRQWAQLLEILRQRGFSESMEDNLICRMRLGDLIVDIMPDDEEILGFSNRWYREALRTAQSYPLSKELDIRVLTPPYFIATKLEAWLGRGNDDPMQSHDIEDIINLIDGREEIVDEIANADRQVLQYISEQIEALLGHQDFEYAVQGNVKDADREALLFERLEQLRAIKSN